MNTEELRVKNESELTSILEELRAKFRNYTFELSAGKIKNVRLIHQTKKEIARILTIMRERNYAKR